MRYLLISVAALALTAGAALAQPDHERGRGREQARDAAAQPQAAQQPQQPQGTWSRDPNRPMQGQPQRTVQGGGGPTSFTNQIQGQQPGPNGERPYGGDRGNWQGRGQQAPQQQAIAPQQQPDRGNWQGRGDRGNWQGRPDDRASYDNRRDYRAERNWGYRSSYNGPRRDWRGYGNYHRDWRPTRRFRAPAYYRPSGWYSHRWTFGEFLPSLFWARDYWLDYRLYDLPPPPYGAVWVRVGDDALMIDDRSGEIITVAYNVFY